MQIRYFVSLALIVPALSTVLAGPPAAGDNPGGFRAADSGVAAFYVIDANGQSGREDPLVSGFVLATASSFPLNASVYRTRVLPDQQPRRRESTPTAKSTRRAAPASLTRIVIRSPSRQATDDRFAEYRCERHGFFYTNDGRCVAPALTRGKTRSGKSESNLVPDTN
jgi:hypothetical protein